MSALVIAAFALATTAEAQQLRYPSTCHDGCMTVTAYYDYGGVRDWNCGSQTYGGHRGTDFAIFGRFTAMDEGREVVAAADGEVITSHDGEFDRCTSGGCGGGGGFGNYVAVRHADGKVVYYGHLRNGSVAVGVGARVTCGQRIGLVGSSGNSTGPHLHFEPRVSGTADDPFGMGGCSGPLIYWVDQGSYRGLPAQSCEAPPEPPPPPPVMNAAVAAVEPGSGSHFAPGATFTAVVTMRNTGETTWTDGESYLLTYDGGERFSGPEQIRLDGASVAPGGEHAFRFDLTAPAAPGEYAGVFVMDRYGTARFGDRAEIRIVVDEPAPPDPPPPDPPPADVDGGPYGADAGAMDPGPDPDPGPGPVPGRPDMRMLEGGCATGGPVSRGTAMWAAVLAIGGILVWRGRRRNVQ